MTTIHPKLSKAIQENNLVIFVGAGASVNLKNQLNQVIGTWSNLVEQIIEHLKRDSQEFNYLKQCLLHHEPIEVLNLIEKSRTIDKKVLYDFVKDYFELHASNTYKVHEKIAKLSNIIITTNYDTAFEESCTNLRNRVAYKGKNYELTTHKDNKPLLFKLHGCVSDAGSMVLFPTNYSDLYSTENSETEHALAVLKNLILNKTILFIGCGMGDFQINHLFKKIKQFQDGFQQPHFIFSKNKLDSSLDFLTPIMITNHNEIETFLDKLLVLKENKEAEKDKERIEYEKQIVALQDVLIETQNKHRELIEELFQEATDFQSIKDYEKALKKYEQISNLEEIDVVFYNCGIILYILALQKKDESLFESSIEKYKKATELNPMNDAFYINWENALFDLAKLKQDETLYEFDFAKSIKATELNPKSYFAYYNWGCNLSYLAVLKKDESLFELSIEKHKKAAKLNPKNNNLYTNWGASISALAKIRKDPSLFELSIKKFIKAIELNPIDYNAYNNWGEALASLAKLYDNDLLYEQSFELLKKGVELGSMTYNLACIYAIRNNKTEALITLETSLIKNEITTNHLKEDKDWELLWEDVDFLTLLEKYKKE